MKTQTPEDFYVQTRRIPETDTLEAYISSETSRPGMRLCHVLRLLTEKLSYPLGCTKTLIYRGNHVCGRSYRSSNQKREQCKTRQFTVRKNPFLHEVSAVP